ncbi:MarR family transcriptional regulator [Bacillus lacus]|uniref:MarR family transcriptional regulator n=1 Tax=Metabacillus lacus TaxID=1983721 RepID=A0A7X2J2V4_9BACI|nr:MarR family transcriptional regulator [Metabacillus lacus]MRX74355.1 MarR family transcriptional regulator [Metabacillus lacus]
MARLHSSILTKYEITSKQFMVLRSVHKLQPVRVQSVAELYQLSMSSVSQLVSKLEKDGYIVRTVNTEDRREIFLTLGTKGEEYFAEHNKVDEMIIEKYYSQLTVEQTRHLRDIARQLHSIVVEEGESP